MSSTEPLSRSWRRSAYRATSKERIDIGYVSVAEPSAIVEWLRSRYEVPEESVYSDLWRDSEPRQLLEYILLRRRNSLVDYGLARYGHCATVLEKVYDRGPVGTRLATLANPRGSIRIKQATDILRRGKTTELTAFFSNPYLVGNLFTKLFERKEAFEGIDETRFATLIYHAAGHPRLSREYNSLNMDGYDDYSYHRTFSTAWELTRTVPANKQWAMLLERLLSRCLRPASFDNVEPVLERWQIEEPRQEGGQWYDRGAGFYLRGLIASLIADDQKLLTSEDAALRMAFYKRLDPYKHKQWSDFFDRDGAEFVHYALENERIWRTEDNRAALRQLCWRCPDKHSTMDYPNDYRAMEKRMREQHPEWFATENAQPTEHQTTASAITSEVTALLQGMLQKLDAMSAKRPSDKGWWVAAGLFVYILLR